MQTVEASAADEREFFIRYRLPRPISRAYESVRLSVEPQEITHRSIWCGQVAMRFIAAIWQALRLAEEGGGSVNPPSLVDLRASLAPSPLADTFGSLDTAPLQRLTADPRRLAVAAQDERPARAGFTHPVPEALMAALAALRPLCDLRLVVAMPDHLNVLLGPRIEYRVGGGEGSLPDAEIPHGVPLLVDPDRGAWLSLAPLVVWEKGARSDFGRLFLLRRVDLNVGHYVEEGVPGCPGCSRTLAGQPLLKVLPEDADLRAALSSPPARFRDGRLLGNHERVLGLIWRGGTADIFAARRLADGRPSVLKTFEYEAGSMDENFRRFVDEERFSQRVRHPGVIASRRLTPGPWGIVHEQEMAQRASLREQLDNAGVLASRLAVEITLELLDILGAVHGAGVVHNDLKPENILFDDNGRVRLIDFGIAASLETSSRDLRPGAPVGSPGYMAPELLRGGTPNIASDLYALGVVLVEMVTGCLARSPGETDALCELPVPLRPALAGLLAEAPEERYAVAQAARRALAEALKRIRPRRAVTLDVEGTLVPSYRAVHYRPGLRQFLEFCRAAFDRLFIYSLLSQDEVREVFAGLALEGVVDDSFLQQYEYVDWPRGADGSLKDLRRCRVPLNANALIDDMRAWVPEDQSHRWVEVRTCGEVLGVDRELERATERLRGLFAIE